DPRPEQEPTAATAADQDGGVGGRGQAEGERDRRGWRQRGAGPDAGDRREGEGRAARVDVPQHDAGEAGHDQSGDEPAVRYRRQSWPAFRYSWMVAPRARPTAIATSASIARKARSAGPGWIPRNWTRPQTVMPSGRTDDFACTGCPAKRRTMTNTTRPAISRI